MNSTELLDLFRVEMTDTAKPYLWADEAVFSYMDTAQKNFCRWTDGIEDSTTPAITQATIAAGDEWVTLDPRVLKIREVVNVATGRPFKLYNTETAAEQGIYFRGLEGRVEAFVTGLTKGKLRAYPKPTEDTDIELRVYRLPLESITDVGDQTLEVDEQHHYHLLTMMKALAYRRPDAETYDRAKADECEVQFRAYCAQARNEQTRVRRSIGVVSYGGL